MDKLSNYIIDFDNIVSVVEEDEYKYCNTNPIKEPVYLKDDTSGQNFLVRIDKDKKSEPNYIELASNLKIKQLVTTNSVSGFVTKDGEFFMLYDGIQYFERITNHIKYAIPGDNIVCLITYKNIPIFVSTCNGQVIDDDYWHNAGKEIQNIYNVKNKFFFVTQCNCLYIFDGCVRMGFTFEEIDNIIQDIIITLDTVTVLTVEGRVWVFGDKEHGAYITNGRGFISGIHSAKQIVRTVRAGAILTEDNSVWAWGSVLYGGSPKPGWVKGLKDNCYKLLSTSTSIIAITLAKQLWAWSNEWFKLYNLMESEFAIASCIDGIFNNFRTIQANKTSWLIQNNMGEYYIIGKSMKKIKLPDTVTADDIKVIKSNYGWLIIIDDIGVLYTDAVIEKLEHILYISIKFNKILVQTIDHVGVYDVDYTGNVDYTKNDTFNHISRSHVTDKYGYMYVTDNFDVYVDGKKIYHNNDAIYKNGVVNYKEVVLYIQYMSEEKKTVKILDKPTTVTYIPSRKQQQRESIPLKKSVERLIVKENLELDTTPTPRSTNTIITPAPRPTNTIIMTPLPSPTNTTTTSSPTNTAMTVVTPPTIIKNNLGQNNSLEEKTPLIQIQPFPQDMGIIEKFVDNVKPIFTFDFIKQNIDIALTSLIMFIFLIFIIFVLIVKIINK
jgi:hypothetical protein